MAAKKSNAGQTEVGQTTEVPRQWYKAGDDVMMAVENLVRHYHPHLLPFVDRIAVLFKTGSATKIGQVSKASPQIGVLADRAYAFVIKLSEEGWAGLSDNHKMALLDHLLCACRTSEDASCATKFAIERPELEYYRGEIERNGFWQHSGVTGPDLAGRIFGDP